MDLERIYWFERYARSNPKEDVDSGKELFETVSEDKCPVYADERSAIQALSAVPETPEKD